MVTSSEVAESKNTASMVASSVLNSLYSLSGSSSMGMERSATESYHSTLSTWSTCWIFSFSWATSCTGISCTTMKEKAPLPKSSFNVSCPMTVSMSLGR